MCALHGAACQPVTACLGAGKGDEVHPRHRQCSGLGRSPFLLGLGRSRQTAGRYLCAWRPASASVGWGKVGLPSTVSLLRLEYLAFLWSKLHPSTKKREREEGKGKKEGRVGGRREGRKLHSYGKKWC